MTLYTVKKDGKAWTVQSLRTGLIQFRSLSRKTCLEWLKDNTEER